MKKLIGAAFTILALLALIPVIGVGFVIICLLIIASILAVMFGGDVFKYEIMRSTTTDETDDDGIVWQTTKTTSRKVWVNGELVSDETRTVEE